MQVIKPVTVFCFVLCSLVAMAQKEPPPFKKFYHIDKADTLPYGILSPINLMDGEKYPLVIFLHGAGERGNDNAKHLKHIQILFTTNTLNKFPCFIVAPQCPKGQSWSDLMAGKPFNVTPTRPMTLFIQSLEKILKDYPIDPARIYVTGVSMGGYGTWDLITRFPKKFAAAIPICGGGDPRYASQIKHIPLWTFHGAKDYTVPPENSRIMIQALLDAGGKPGYTEYPDVEHNSWVHAYREPFLMPWLYKQILRGSD
jgi:predicted peptidase